MAGYLNVIRKQFKPNIEALLADIKARKDKDFFNPTGTQVYTGRQGSGKTVSAVKHVLDIKKRYPKCIVVTNINLSVPWDYISFQTGAELMDCLTNINNGFHGVIYLIDEIPQYYNALDSKNIPPEAFVEIAQQRKQRKCIVGTAQLFLRLAKPFREQCDNIIVCSTYMGMLTTQKAYDGMDIDQDYQGKLSGHLKQRGWFYHTNKLRETFDTYQKITPQNGSLFENSKPLELKPEKQTIFSRRK